MSDVMDKKHDLPALEEIYKSAEEIDTDIFSHMKTNLLLYAGEQYTKKNHALLTRTRSASESNSDSQRLRLVKNHTQKICKNYINNIMQAAPGVRFSPKNEKELQDQKSAELHNAVWEDAKERYNLKEKFDEYCEDMVTIGECAVKILWDENAGDIQAYEQAIDDAGNPEFDANGQPKPGKPVYSGDFVFERLFAFNLLRCPSSKDIDETPYLINRKMVGVAKLKASFPEYKDKIQESADTTILIFDGNSGQYRRSKNECLVKEYFFRPCPLYPRGYFFIATKEVILSQGELPGGVFPIVWKYFDRIQTSPRGVSIIKVVRPYQVEINRAGSKMAEHQITLGDDKLLIQNGTQVSAGASLPGVRTVNYVGLKPEILQGRSGEQYLDYMNSQIKELYDIVDIDVSDTSNSNTDPYLILYKAASQKKKYIRYHRRFEDFQRNFAQTYIDLAKIYMPDDRLIQAVGRSEAINIPEFKNAPNKGYEVVLEAQSEDVETKLGRQMFMNQVLQYVGGKLDKEDIGKIIRSAPYSNVEETFSDMTLNYDTATNIILALDRGQGPVFSMDQDHLYILKRLTNRMLLSDYTMLPENIRMNYEARRQMHEQAQAEIIKQTQLLQSGFIPTNGYLVACDFYVPTDPKNPEKTKRVRLPSSALQWLIEKLSSQGQTLDVLEDQNQGMVAELAKMVTGRVPMASPPPQNVPISQKDIGNVAQQPPLG